MFNLITQLLLTEHRVGMMAVSYLRKY